jgi:hypothetical protein
MVAPNSSQGRYWRRMDCGPNEEKIPAVVEFTLPCGCGRHAQHRSKKQNMLGHGNFYGAK